jgi:Flp pilus assembly protein TadG
MNAMARVTGLLCLRSRGRHQIGFVRTCIQRSNERGSSLVELAVCLPILMMIVTGITSFGFAINSYITLTNAVEVGGRQLAILRGNTVDPCSDVTTTIAAAAPLLKSANLNYTITLNGTTYTSSTSPGTSKSCGTAGAALLTQGKPVTVQVTYPCTLLIYGKNLVPSCTLSAQVTELEQ